MTRKDFILLAKNIALIDNYEIRYNAFINTANACKQSNSRFDITKFANACNINLNK
jgi:hypothetical protein